MQIFSVLLAAISVCVYTLDSDFAYVSENVLLKFPEEQEREIYVLREETSPNRLCSVLFMPVSRDKTAPSLVSPLRFLYDEAEARTRCQEAGDIAREVSSFLAEHAAVDARTGTVWVVSQNTQAVFQLTEQKMFFVSFQNGELSVLAVPEGIAEVSVPRIKESGIDYLYKKEKEHGNLFDNFLIAEECKREDKRRILNFPEKRKEAALLLAFLAEKEFQIGLEELPDMHGEEGNKWGLKIPYGISLFVTKENSCCLELFDLTKTKIKKLTVTSFDITKMNLKNTTIEELFLVDEMAFNFFYNTIVRSVFCVEKFSFGGKSNLQSEKVLKLVERVHEGENLTQGKIKTLALNKNNFFDFLEKASRTGQKEIHVEDLAVIQKAGKKRPEIETSTRFFVSKKISIRGNARVLLFVVLGPELNHLDIGESQKQCRSLIDIPRIWFVLTKNGIVIKENVYPFNFLKKNITATEVSFFTTSRKDALEKNKIKLVSEELENISFKYKGLSALLAITNRKIKVRHMAVLDTDICFSRQEKEEIIGKTFVIREKLYMKNTGVFFVELLGNTVFIPVIEIEIDCCTEDWRGFKKTNDIRVETNALLKSIKTQIKGARYIEKAIQQVIAQKETVVENNSGYPKLVFEEDNNHEEQNEQGESEEQSAAECQIHEVFKEYLKHKEQHGPGESSEQPRIEKQEFVEDNYTLSEGELEKYIPKDLFFSEED